MANKLVKKIAKAFRSTPLHPQWLIFRHEKKNLVEICGGLHFTVLDIGCADKKPKRYLPESVYYCGLDYYSTATNWYMTRPDLFADATHLPLKDESFENVLLLDVLEHLPDPSATVTEIYRVLKPAGKLIILVPFMYPVHDAPLDFHRWTSYGLCKLVQNSKFRVLEEKYYGQPVETAFLLVNLALSKTTLNMFKTRNPLLVIFLPLLPFIVLLSNLLSIVGNLVFPKDKFMPHGYRLLLVKDK